MSHRDAGAARVSAQRCCRELPLIANPVAVDDEPGPDVFALVAGDQFSPGDARELDHYLDLFGIERSCLFRSAVAAVQVQSSH